MATKNEVHVFCDLGPLQSFCHERHLQFPISFLHLRHNNPSKNLTKPTLAMQ